MEKEKDKEEIIHISFNQDQSYFAVGTQKGFKVYKLGQEIEEIVSRQFGAGVGIIEMINKTNIFAMVGGGKTPRYPKNKLMIWDDFQMKCIIETSCKSEVKAVKISSDKVVIILETKIFLFRLADFRALETLETCPNPKGLCTISSLKQSLILAFPSKKVGTVEIFNELNEQDSERHKIEAHKSCLCALQLCSNGYKLATASEKGTIIRIFDTATLQCLQELRRGTEYATIYSLAFDLQSNWLVCTSDSGTVHIFGLCSSSEQTEKQEIKNTKSKLSIFSKISSYFDSEWSWASYHTTEKRTKACFLGKDGILAVVSMTGAVSIIQFSKEKSGECEKMAEYSLFESRTT